MKEINEGNKLIFDFMGGVRIAYTKLEYHSSWDWLMPVVEKIESMKDGEYPFVVIMFKRCCDIERDTAPDADFIQITAANTKIEAVWLAVVKFIQWHNKAL